MPQYLIKFALVGVVATLAYYVVALSLTSSVGVFWANAGGYAVGMGVSYFGHRRFTFSATRNMANHRRAISRFLVSSGIAFTISQVILFVIILILQLPEFLALAVVVFTIPPVTFLLCQLWVFVPDTKQGSAISS